jgi:branched-chain amino acid transport system substrate-binding protein
MQTLGHVGFDAVLLPASGAQLKTIAPLLPFYDIDTSTVRLLGMADWHEAGLGREPALAGAWFAGPPPTARAEFESRYRRTYGRPPHRLAVLAYDATALAAVLASAEGGVDFSDSALTAENGFSGMAGIFRLNPDGLVQRGLAVMQVEPDGVSVIDPAPESFDEAID